MPKAEYYMTVVALMWGLVIVGLVSSTADAIPFLGPLSPSEKIEKPDESYRQGLEALGQGNLERAERAFKESWKSHPGQVNAALYLAEIAHRRKQPVVALGYLQQAREADADNQDVYVSLGRLYFSEKDYDSARKALEKAVELAPKAASPRVDLGVLYYKAFGDHGKAVRSLKEAIKIDPTKAGAHYALGTIYFVLENYAAAVKEFETAIRVAPQRIQGFAQLGLLHTRRKAYDKALSTYSRLLQRHPGNLAAYLARGDIYGYKGEPEKALKEYTAALKRSPRWVPAMIRIGMIHQAQGRLSEAEKVYLEAIELNPNAAVAYNNLAAIMLERGLRLDDALKWAEKAVQLLPDNPDFQDTLKLVRQAQDRL